VRRYYIAGNWKMHKTIAEASELARRLTHDLAGARHKVMIAPPFTALATVSQILEGSNILLGAQNMGQTEQGAHTGEVSVLMLKDIGVSVVILGHSERRLIYGETDELVNAKVKLALMHGLEVILCVGETLAQREAGKVDKVVADQVERGLSGVDDLGRVTIAYEPVWAIGTGKNATPADADAVHRVIRETIARRYGKTASDAIIIQYGGSVKADNAASLMAMENVDGALVGGASLTADGFVPIVEFDRH